MDRQQSQTLSCGFKITCLLFCSAIIGCQNGPMAGRMQQSQLESDRLLSEYRAQKRENEQLRADRTRLMQQQAESEKLAARLQAQLNASRTLAGSSNTSRRPASSNNTFRSNPLKNDIDARSASRPTRGDSSTDENGDSDLSGLQWRPIRK